MVVLIKLDAYLSLVYWSLISLFGREKYNKEVVLIYYYIKSEILIWYKVCQICNYYIYIDKLIDFLGL